MDIVDQLFEELRHKIPVEPLGICGTPKKRICGKRYSTWKGPLPGCPIAQRHRRKYCQYCKTAEMRRYRKNHNQ